MWLFDPAIAHHRMSRKFLVRIADHVEAGVVGKFGKIDISDVPLVAQLSVNQCPVVTVGFRDTHTRDRTEEMKVACLRPRCIPEGDHIIITGERKGTLVKHVKTKGKQARVYIPGTVQRKDGFYVVSTDLCAVE